MKEKLVNKRTINTKESRECSKSKVCKAFKCIHHSKHETTNFCDETCDTFTDAVCSIN